LSVSDALAAFNITSWESLSLGTFRGENVLKNLDKFSLTMWIDFLIFLYYLKFLFSKSPI